jgi:hypothetical protein
VDDHRKDAPDLLIHDRQGQHGSPVKAARSVRCGVGRSRFATV